MSIDFPSQTCSNCSSAQCVGHTYHSCMFFVKEEYILIPFHSNGGFKTVFNLLSLLAPMFCNYKSVLSKNIFVNRLLIVCNNYLLTYSMVQSPPWEANWFAASQEIPRIHGTRRFITALTSVRHLSLSWASPIQSIYPHPTSCRSILILSTHLRLVLPSGLFPSGFPTKTLYTTSPHPYAPHAQPVSFFSILSPAQYWVSSTPLRTINLH